MPRKNSRHLTDLMISKLPKAPKGKRYEEYDSGVPSLCIRVTDKGHKSWSVFYRFGDERPRMTIGPWPPIKVAKARELAREIRQQAADGTDPKTKRQAEKVEAERQAEIKARRRFGHLAEQYIKRECGRLARGGEVEAIIRRELMPHWRDRSIDELRKRDAIELTDALVDAGKPAAAHKLHSVIKRLGNWFVERDELEVSPFANLKPPVEKVVRDRGLKDAEIAAIWGATERMGYPYGPLIQLLLLTGQRRTEVASMTWGEIDLDKVEWILPGERSKNRKPHLVPLSEPAVAILEGLPKFKGQYVFTTTSGKKPVPSYSWAKRRVDDLIEADNSEGIEAWRFHDLRRTCRSGMAALGVPEIVGERVLNHQPRGLTRVYNVHEYKDEKRDALARWAQRVLDIVTPPPANVVRIERAS